MKTVSTESSNDRLFREIHEQVDPLIENKRQAEQDMNGLRNHEKPPRQVNYSRFARKPLP